MSKKKDLEISLDWIQAYALKYLSRYSSSSKNLEYVIKKRIKKISTDNECINSNVESWIKFTINKLEQNKYLDDLEFAKAKAISLFKSGKPSRIIFAKLKNLGISDEYIHNAIKNVSNHYVEDNSDEDIDFKAAKIFARKKNISFSNSNEESSKQNKNEIQKFLRAGYSFATISKLFNLNLIEYDS